MAGKKKTMKGGDPTKTSFDQTGNQRNSLQNFQENNSPTTLKQSLNGIRKTNSNYNEKIREIANKTFDLLSSKFDLAIKFLDTIGRNRKLKKDINKLLVNNAVYEDKNLATNIGILYNLWTELIDEHSKSFTNAYKKEFEEQKSIIEEKKQNYSQKMFDIQPYVRYVNYHK
jgi:hypothetical protein